MSGLDHIGIKVIDGNGPSAERTGAAVAILQEIAVLLDALLTTSAQGGVDLRSLPMLPGDYRHLQELLGEGEVTATVDASGPTKVRETRYPGVWWVTYYDTNDAVVAERIEVTFLPEILESHPDDVRAGAERLHQSLG